MRKAWVEQWFSARTAQQGGVIRRRADYVEKFTSLDEIEQEARKRGWHVVVVGEQVIVLCNNGKMTVVC